MRRSVKVSFLLALLSYSFHTFAGSLIIHLDSAPDNNVSDQKPILIVTDETTHNYVANNQQQWGTDWQLDNLTNGDTYSVAGIPIDFQDKHYESGTSGNVVVDPNVTNKISVQYLLQAKSITPVGKINYHISGITTKQNAVDHVTVGFIDQSTSSVITKELATNGSTSLYLPVGQYAVFTNKIINGKKYKAFFTPNLIDVTQTNVADFSLQYSNYVPLKSSAFAPYIDLSWTQNQPFTSYLSQNIHALTLGFMANKQKQCAIDIIPNGTTGMNMPAEISAYEGGNANVILSIRGGSLESNPACQSADFDQYVQNIQNALGNAIQTFQVYNLDFLERETNLTTDKSVAHKALAKALANLQAQDPDLLVNFTLPALTSGISANAISFLSDVLSQGMNINHINLLAMDYGDGIAPPDKMGQNAIDVAQSTFTQLQTLYPNKPSNELWAMIGLTPMIGKNDVATETFTKDDAAQVTAFAKQQGLGYLSIWTLNRDKQCTSDTKQCSGINQNPYDFSKIFEGFNS